LANNTLNTIIRWVVTLAIPFFLILGTVRLLIAWDSPSYPEFEYGRIAPDVFGFTQEERLALADATLDYMQRPESAEESIYLLEDLRLPGTDRPLYNPEEIGHMIDVKNVADTFRTVTWVLGLVILGSLIYLFWRPPTRLLGATALLQGGLLTVLLVLGIMLFMLVAWSLAFTVFHNLFFAEGTWTFAYSDSLIRLFPEQFWFDFGILWTSLIMVGGLLSALAGYLLRRAWS
jgi:integral membrane protein (TIGR01906 family)